MPKGYKHLTLKQRCQIFQLKSSNTEQKTIASILGVSTSTISREIKRNSGEEGYVVWQASFRSEQRRMKASRKPKKMTASLISEIESHLKEQWSPEQISGRLKLTKTNISHETIYKYIWIDKKNCGELYKNLRHSSKKYNRRKSGKNNRGKIPGRVDISERPNIVDLKSRIGDWEGDTIVGKDHNGAILSIVDRSSKYTILERLTRKTAMQVSNAAIKRLALLSKNKLHTITFDNGSEFCRHNNISQRTGAKCYFATPYRSWERGLNEHTNGLVRQYFAKGTDFLEVTDIQVENVQNILNKRPRKVLGFRTPEEVFTQAG